MYSARRLALFNSLVTNTLHGATKTNPLKYFAPNICDRAKFVKFS